MKRTSTWIKIILFCISLMALSSCGRSSDNEGQITLIVSAAASLSQVLEEVVEQFEQENEHIDVLVNYGSSGSLQRQIEQGAPVDLFFSAGKLQVDRLVDKHIVDEVDTDKVLTNALVVIEPKDKQTSTTQVYSSIAELLDEAKPTYIALGETDTVPAGIYAKQALQHEQLWQDWQGYAVYGKDVKEVLAFVEQGNADLGIVYASDAKFSNKVNIIYNIPSTRHDPILYVAALIKESKQQKAAAQLMSYLQDVKWTDTYERYGFIKVD